MGVPAGNRFLTDRIGEMTRDGFQMSGKRRRTNTGGSDSEQRSVFMLSNGDDKLNIIFDEIVNIRNGQEKTHRGMLAFQNSFTKMAEKVSEVIQVTNKNTDMLKTLAYKSIDLEARSRRNNLIFWGLVENREENCFALIRQFIKNELDLDADNMYLARAHRLGPVKIGYGLRKRPLIVNFRDYCDTEAIMRNAHMLRRTPFSVDYDYPKEISTARKAIWSEIKTIKSQKPNAKCHIVYPAKLSVDGKIVRDELPNWSEILKGNRLGDFSYIDQQPAFHFDITDHDHHTDSNMEIQDYSEHIDRDEETLFSRDNVSDQNVCSPVKSQTNADTTVNSEWVSPTQHSETVHNPSNPGSTCTNTNNATDLQCLSAAALSKNSEKSVPQNPFFRPFNSDTAKSPNLENPKRAEHVSRTLQRGARRSHSLSIPRSRQRGTSPVNSHSKNRQCSSKNSSVSRENSKKPETVTARGAKNKTIAESGDKNSQPSVNIQD